MSRSISEVFPDLLRDDLDDDLLPVSELLPLADVLLLLLPALFEPLLVLLPLPERLPEVDFEVAIFVLNLNCLGLDLYNYN